MNTLKSRKMSKPLTKFVVFRCQSRQWNPWSRLAHRCRLSLVLSRTQNNKGGAHEPIAIETPLGWVLSGPLRRFCQDSQINENFVGHNLSRNVDHSELECMANSGTLKPDEFKRKMKFMKGWKMQYSSMVKDMKCTFPGKKELGPFRKIMKIASNTSRDR